MMWRTDPDLAWLFAGMETWPVEAKALPECVRCRRPVSGERCPVCRAVQSTYKEKTK